MNLDISFRCNRVLKMEVTCLILLLQSYLFAMLTSVKGCSLPQGWERKTLPQLVIKADLVIFGEFLDVTNSTNTQNPERTDVRINTAVHCVLKNTNTVDVAATIVIEDFVDPYDGRCVDNLVDVKTSGNMVVFVSKKENNNFEFDGYNVQSASWRVNDEALNDVMRTCAVMNATAPMGASTNQCPKTSITTDTCSDSGTQLETTLTTLLISVLFVTFL